MSPRDLQQVAWAAVALGVGDKRLLRKIAKVSSSRVGDFNSQELLVLTGALQRGGVGSRRLAPLLAPQTLSLTLGGGTGVAKAPFILDARPSGSKFQGTGVALWEASFVLADWFLRHDGLGSLPGVSLGGRRRKKTGWKEVEVVEMGAGLGLPSLALARCGATVYATDGDDDVLELLAANAERDVPNARKGGGVSVHKLMWGDEIPRVLRKADVEVVVAADIVYGNDESVWAKLLATLGDLTTTDTLVFFALVPRFRDGERTFFRMCAEQFEVIPVPNSSLHPDHRDGTCSLYVLTKKPGEVQGQKKKRG